MSGEALVERLAEAIWTTSRADEGTISATGAKIVARALLPVVEREIAAAVMKARAEAWDEGWAVGADDQKNWSENTPGFKGAAPNPYRVTLEQEAER